MKALSLREAVQICSRTTWRFRRRSWHADIYCTVSSHGSIWLHGVDTRMATFYAADVLADDWEVVRG